MERATAHADVLALLADAPKPHPRALSDPMNILWLFQGMPDQATVDYLWGVRKTLMVELKKVANREALAEAAVITASKRAKKLLRLGVPAQKAEVSPPRAEVISRKRVKLEVDDRPPKDNRALKDAWRERRQPSSIEWAVWRGDNPEYVKKTKSRKREREVAVHAVGDVGEPLSKRGSIAEPLSEDYTSASSQSLSSES